MAKLPIFLKHSYFVSKISGRCRSTASRCSGVPATEPLQRAGAARRTHTSLTPTVAGCSGGSPVTTGAALCAGGDTGSPVFPAGVVAAEPLSPPPHPGGAQRTPAPGALGHAANGHICSFAPPAARALFGLCGSHPSLCHAICIQKQNGVHACKSACKSSLL